MRKCITVLLTAFLLGCFSNCTIPYSSIWISNGTDDTVKIYMNYRDSLLPAYIPYKTSEWKERCSQCFSVEYVFKNPPKLIYDSKDEGGIRLESEEVIGKYTCRGRQVEVLVYPHKNLSGNWNEAIHYGIWIFNRDLLDMIEDVMVVHGSDSTLYKGSDSLHDLFFKMYRKGVKFESKGDGDKLIVNFNK